VAADFISIKCCNCWKIQSGVIVGLRENVKPRSSFILVFDWLIKLEQLTRKSKKILCN